MKIPWNLSITNLALGMGSNKIENKDLIDGLDDLGIKGAIRAVKLLGIDTRNKIERGETHEKMLTELIVNLEHKLKITHPIIVVACTQTDTVTIPSLARRVATNLNITGPGHIFQLQTGCTGFVESLSLVNSQISSFGLLQGLILNADIFSNLITTENWMSAITYSDGASAVAVKKQRQKFALYDAFHFDNSGCISLDLSNRAYTSDGAKTFEFTSREVRKVLEHLKAESESNSIRISHIFFNQTNQQVVSFIKNLINKFFPRTMVPTNVKTRGNLNSASIPALIYDNRISDENIDPSKYSVFLTFGAGLGVTYLAIPNTTFNQIDYCT